MDLERGGPGANGLCNIDGGVGVEGEGLDAQAVAQNSFAVRAQVNVPGQTVPVIVGDQLAVDVCSCGVARPRDAQQLIGAAGQLLRSEGDDVAGGIGVVAV